MRLDEMLESVSVGAVPPLVANGLQYDSRKLQRGDAFFAFLGEHVDGHRFVPNAMEAGAAAIVSERVAPEGLEGQWARVSHGHRALALSALRFYGRPDRQLKLTGVTGTNGKTSTVYLIDSLLRSAGKVTARFGTIEHRVANRAVPAINTTPESLDVIRYLVELRDLGGTHATMEVSSHGLEIGRVYGMDFHTAVFTNLSQDHLDFHGDMQSYAAAKRRLFEGAGGAVPRFAVINLDDEIGRDLLTHSKSEKLSYGRTPRADVAATAIETSFDGVKFTAETPVGAIDVNSPMNGDFNVENILAAIATALTYEIPAQQIERGLRETPSVPGRFETVNEGQPFLVVVDYAHTDDALKRLIESARVLLSSRGEPGRVLTLFGCGGNRDRGKRPAMGRVAGQLSDWVILTSDNPRNEDPTAIIRDAEAGLGEGPAPYEIEPDRAAAIEIALNQARSGDIVLIAGKGHEPYQVVGEVKLPFDDRETARKVLNELGYHG